MITVFGLLGSPSAELRASAAAADWVVGGRRHLDALAVPDTRRITLGALRLAIAQIAALPPTSAVTVVASGDPLFFGVVRSLRAAGLQPRVVTAPSSIAARRSRIGSDSTTPGAPRAEQCRQLPSQARVTCISRTRGPSFFTSAPTFPHRIGCRRSWRFQHLSADPRRAGD